MIVFLLNFNFFLRSICTVHYNRSNWCCEPNQETAEPFHWPEQSFTKSTSNSKKNKNKIDPSDDDLSNKSAKGPEVSPVINNDTDQKNDNGTNTENHPVANEVAHSGKKDRKEKTKRIREIREAEQAAADIEFRKSKEKNDAIHFDNETVNPIKIETAK